MEMELQDYELQWTATDWFDTIVDNLRGYLRLNGIVSKETELMVLSNLCEVQDNVIKLNKYSDSYTDRQMKNMRECLAILLKCSKIDSPLKNIFEKTAKRLMNYLGKVKGQDYYPYYEEKANQEKITEEMHLRLDKLLEDVSNEIQREEKEKRDKRTQVTLTKEKTLVELQVEKEKKLSDKIARVADLLILKRWKERYG